MDAIKAIVARFPHRELAIRRCFAHDAVFRSICADYADALDAREHWRRGGHRDARRSEEYARLAQELELELGAILDRTTQPSLRP
ncbi:hypothetical protein [Acuticoccus kandeliae]|uniref:hypothetical protein n=1 Tax=Acuticoccus kandeliae TaxID=2073160 RepID=UPI000D3E5BE5|nr:hypothetical protein [Acuticoccus kandeliae]